MLRFYELRNSNSPQFNLVIKHCREVFHYSIKDISLLAERLHSNNDRVKTHILYADCLGEFTGFAVFYYFPKSRFAFIENLIVLNDYRNQGIGSQLYFEMVDFLKERYPECVGHMLEMCREKDNYLKRKAFFLKQGCIPVNLNFFLLDAAVKKSEMWILYHPYRPNQEYSLTTMDEIFKEMAVNLVHQNDIPVQAQPQLKKATG